MNDISDTVQTLAAVALFAKGPTTITGVAHIRHKETDRIGDLARELRKLGAAVDELTDGLRIRPAAIRPAQIATYQDHRMAMSMALVGLPPESPSRTRSARRRPIRASSKIWNRCAADVPTRPNPLPTPLRPRTTPRSTGATRQRGRLRLKF